MAHTGDRFEMPDTSVYEVTAAASDSDGAFVGMDFTLPPGSAAPPPHIHPTPEESFEVVEGVLDLMVEGRWSSLKPGETASVAAGILHTFKNRSGETVRLRNVHRPALRFEDYIEHTYRLLKDRKVTGIRDPRAALYLSMLMREYPETIRPGRVRERVAVGALAGLGRLFGLRTVVPRKVGL